MSLKASPGDRSMEVDLEANDKRNISLTSLVSDESMAVKKKTVSAPEWNLKGYMTVAGAFFLSLNSWGILSSFGVFQTQYTLSILNGSSAWQISWIGSFQSFTFFLVSFGIGPVFDAGHLRPLLWAGSILSVLGMFMTSLCSEYWQFFLAQGLTIGLGIGNLFVPAPSLISLHFEKHRALAIGLSSVGGGVGGIVFPIIFDELLPSLGFAWTTRALAFILLMTSLIPLALVSYQGIAVSTATVGTDTKLETSNSESSAASKVLHALLDVTAFRETPFMIGMVALMFGMMGIYTISNYINLFAIETGLNGAHTAWSMLLIINSASCLGRTAPMVIADRIGHCNMLAIAMFLSGALVFCLLVVDTLQGCIGWSVVFGITSGAGHALAGAVVSTLSSKLSRIGTRQGMALGVAGCGMLVASPIAGAIVEGPAGWLGLLAWSGTLLILSALCAGVALIMKR